MLVPTRRLVALLAVLPIVVTVAQLKMHAVHPDRDVIAQLFEWRFDDIADDCERHLGPKGYAAVQVSPVNEHLVFEGGPWWDRYQPISYRIASRSGDEQQFAEMSRRCNKAGVRVIVDVVLNHMAGSSPPPVRGYAGTPADPPEFSFPGVPFKRKHFNPTCTIEHWNDAPQLRDCEYNELRDLNQTLPYVRQKQVEFLNRLVALGAGGFRVDAAKHMWPHNLHAIFSAVDNLNEEFGFAPKSRPYVILEMVDFGSSTTEIGRFEFTHVGRVTDFLIPGELGRSFRGYNNLKWLRNWGPQWTFLPAKLGVLFVTDHELSRGKAVGSQDTISFKDGKLYRQATAFLLAHPLGTPRITSLYTYTDENQGPPVDKSGEVLSPGKYGCLNGFICEHRWLAVANMVEWRVVAGQAEYTNWWDNQVKHIAFSRGDRAFVAFNGAKKGDFEWKLQTCLPAGRYCDVLSGLALKGRCTGVEVEVDENGEAMIRIAADSDNGVLGIHVGATSSLSRTSQRMTFQKFMHKVATTTCYTGIRLHLRNYFY